MRWHYHHIIPRHMGGTDNPSNLLRCNVAMHAFLHKLLFERHGYWQDRVAWLGLSGQMGKDELMLEFSRQGMMKINALGLGGTKNKKFRKRKEMCSGLKNSTFGKISITNGEINRYVASDLVLPEGFYRGRTIKRHN